MEDIVSKRQQTEMSASGDDGSVDMIDLSAVNSNVERLLECPVCLKFMDGHIFQCESGHPACGACRPRLKNHCPLCKKAFLNTRNLPLEHIAEQIYRPCVSEGCQDMLTIAQQNEHMFECKHREIQCPTCAWKGSIRIFADHVESANHHVYSNIFEFGRPINMVVDRNWWYKIDGDRNVFHLRALIDDGGPSWFCCRLFGTRSVADRFRFKLELQSMPYEERRGAAAASEERRGTAGAPKSPPSKIIQQSSLSDDMHCDLEHDDGHCIPLLNYDGLLRWGLVSQENKLFPTCTVFRK